jgi:hypothetical protein
VSALSFATGGDNATYGPYPATLWWSSSILIF